MNYKYEDKYKKNNYNNKNIYESIIELKKKKKII